MLRRCLTQLRQRVQRGVDALRTRVSRWTKPRPVALTVGVWCGNRICPAVARYAASR